jgi:hypothetical protein
MFTASDFYRLVNQPFWSLMLEIWFSIVMPILIIAAWRFGYWRVPAITIAVALVVRLVGMQLSFATVMQNPAKDSIVGSIDDFMIGVVVARLYVGGQIAQDTAVAFCPWRHICCAVGPRVGPELAGQLTGGNESFCQSGDLDRFRVRVDVLPPRTKSGSGPFVVAAAARGRRHVLLALLLAPVG